MADPLALPKMIVGLKSDDWQERLDATFAVARMGEEAKAAVPALIEILADTDILLRKMAVVAVGAFGRDAGQTVTGLAEVLLHDEESSVRRLAAVSLGQIGAEAILELEQTCEDNEDDDLRVTAADALEELEANQARAAAA